jgi:hypothetical protein
MAPFEELLYLHPTSVMARLAAEPRTPRLNASGKPKRAGSERRFVFRPLQLLRAATRPRGYVPLVSNATRG